MAAICGSGSSVLIPARSARIAAATPVNWSIMSLWCARNEGVAWISVPKRWIEVPAWTGSSWAASQEVMALSSSSRIRSAASTGGIPGSARPVRSEAIVASRRFRISDSLVGK